MLKKFAVLAGCFGLLFLVAPNLASAQTDEIAKAFQLPPLKAAPSQCDNSSIVQVGKSSICGFSETADVYAYEGISYATALRWAPPKPSTLPPQVSALKFGDVCPQMKDKLPIGDENCLYLNVWTPKNALASGAKPVPVMVFIHGGAFISGAGSVGLYDGSAAAAQGVTVVTINYRLGALGFLAADKLTSGKTIDGNFGLLDQQMAMKWVVDHIAAFGGDPTKITLFGESAGAMSVALHTFDMPESAPLFQQAIMESNPAGIVYRTRDKALAQGDKFLAYMCKDFYKQPTETEVGKKDPSAQCAADPTWLDKLTTGDIVTSQLSFIPSKTGPLIYSLLTGVFSLQALPWQPVIDDVHVFGEPYDGFSAKVPSSAYTKTLAVGTNADEGTIFTAFGYMALPKLFSKTGYNTLIATKFAKHARAIRSTDRYRGDKQKLPDGSSGYENQYSAAFANVMTDYAFTCGNLSAANHAISKGATVYAYHFTQAPFFDLYAMQAPKIVPDKGACAPASGYTCHANELAYVFNTVDYLPLENPTYVPKPGDKALAAAMNTAWVQFAKGNISTATGWTPYAPGAGGEAELWTSKKDADPTVKLDQVSNCSKIWLGAWPYVAGR